MIGISPQVSGKANIKYGAENLSTSITGTNEKYKSVGNIKIAKGRFLNEFDVEQNQKVAVIGSYIAKEFFKEDDAINKEIKINGTVFEIIGVAEEKQSSVQGGTDDCIYIPYTTATRLIKNSKVSTYTIQGKSSEIMSDAKEKLSTYLKNFFGTDKAFLTLSQDEILQQVNTITGTLSAMLGGIAAISLVVGGIGIMNIMLVSVTERTREIGIRKAIGAKRRTIMLQFLIESIILSLIGGILGILLGFVLTKIIGSMIDVETTVTASIITLAVAFSTVIGIFFGMYPASKASKLNPIDALRYE